MPPGVIAHHDFVIETLELGVDNHPPSIRLGGRGSLKDGVLKTIVRGLAQGAFPKLERLYLPSMHIKEDDVEALADTLEARMKLGCKGLIYNPVDSAMGGGMQAFKRVCRCTLPTMTSLDLTNGTIAAIYAECLRTIEASAMEDLVLSDFEPEQQAHLLSIIQSLVDSHMPALAKIDVDHSNVHGEAIGIISQAIEKGAWPQLQKLNLRGTSLTGNDVQGLMQAIVSSHHGLPCLRKLDLGRNKDLGANGATHIAKAIEAGAFCNLERLNLGSCDIGNEGLTALSHAWKKKKMTGSATCMINELYLEDNNIGAEGMEKLADALAEGALPHLRELILSRNAIGDDGLTALSKAFAKGGAKKLKELDLDGCNIGSAGLTSLSAAFQDGACADLEKLNIDHLAVEDRAVDRALGLLVCTFAFGSCPNLKLLLINESFEGKCCDILKGMLARGGRDGLVIFCIELGH